MPVTPLPTQDFWRVNSYGYPNPFIQESKSQEAWTTFLSFVQHDKRPYTSLKQFWDSPDAPRKLNSHAVESWKATFEEFGLLYVISRSNEIVVTPAGKQFHDAANRQAEKDFVWIGLNLLLRYPLQGPPRGRAKSAAHGNSNLLLYRFLYSAARDLGDYFWWTELERVFCRVFLTSEAKQAVEIVHHLRQAPGNLPEFPLPVTERKGGFYNSLNQVVVHAGMNHLLLTQDNETEYYGSNESRRRHFVNRDYLNLISAALGDPLASDQCSVSALYVDRLPNAPTLTDENSYFEYLGAPVALLQDLSAAVSPQVLTISGDTVFVLKVGEHIELVSSSGLERKIRGNPHILCRIARNHRVIVSADRMWTYLVTGKDLAQGGSVILTLRRARPISNASPIDTLLGGEDA